MESDEHDPLSDDPAFLAARVKICGDLFEQGEITSDELIRVCTDRWLGVNSGLVKFQKNNDYQIGKATLDQIEKTLISH
jgi:hypothetical protein